MKMRILILSICVLLSVAATADAVGFIGVGPRAGYYRAQDADEGRWMGGACGRVKLGSAIGIEGSIDYRSEKWANGALTVRSWPVMATAMIYPLPIVYGLAGFGWYNTTFDYDQSRLLLKQVEDETKQEVGWHFGGGLELPLGSLTSLTADVRYVFLDYDFSEIPGSEDMKANFYAITVGILIGL